MLLDDPENADLPGKVAQAWEEFAQALAELLPSLLAGTQLHLTLDPTASGTADASYSVTVRVVAGGEVSALAVSNSSLPEGFQMNRAAVAGMVALGWSPPGVEPGSGGQFGLTTTTGNARQLATILSRTLRDIYGAPHPAFLVYLVHDLDGGAVPVAPLGSARAGTAPPDAGSEAPDLSHLSDLPESHDAALLRQQVRTVIAAMQQTTPEHLPADADGDIGIRAGSAMVFVKVRDDPPLVDVLSPLLTQISPSEHLYGKLSELTNRMPIGRLYCANDTVWASVPVIGRSFQPTHLVLAVQVMTGLADELDDRLHGEFGGRRFFGEDDKPSHYGEHHGTGMYL